MSTRSKTNAKKSKKAENEKYQDYEFLEEEEEVEDPFATDGDTDEYVPDEKESPEEEEHKEEKKQPKRKTPSQKKATKSYESSAEGKKRKKVGATANKDDKLKLASIIKDEEIIYNLKHKLHSNLSALSAAWERVAKKMDKPGEYILFFFILIQK